MGDVKSQAEIRNELNAIKSLGIMEYSEKLKRLSLFYDEYSQDERKSIKTIVASASKLYTALNDEIKRVETMMNYDYSAGDEYEYICGVDEVGRGPLAGPIMAAAVIMPKDLIIPYINDSKQVRKEMREELYNYIIENAVSYAVGMREASFIDSDGIQSANLYSMRDAVLGLDPKPDMVLVDAVKIPDIDIYQRNIIKGDATSFAIAAASIVAKVTRDRLMEEYDKLYPEYGFAENSGYGTEKHRNALETIGPCEIHRRSFIKKYI